MQFDYGFLVDFIFFRFDDFADAESFRDLWIETRGYDEHVGFNFAITRDKREFAVRFLWVRA